MSEKMIHKSALLQTINEWKEESAAKAEHSLYHVGYDDCLTAVQDLISDALEVALDAVKRLEIDTVKNEHLALEELRGMDGHPVWVVGIFGDKSWHLVNVGEEIVVDSEKTFWNFDAYGKTWLAYRNKPKEASK